MRWTDPIPVRRRGTRASTHREGIVSARPRRLALCGRRQVPKRAPIRLRRRRMRESVGDFPPPGRARSQAAGGLSAILRGDDQLKARAGAFVLVAQLHRRPAEVHQTAVRQGDAMAIAIQIVHHRPCRIGNGRIMTILVAVTESARSPPRPLDQSFNPGPAPWY